MSIQFLVPGLWVSSFDYYSRAPAHLHFYFVSFFKRDGFCRTDLRQTEINKYEEIFFSSMHSINKSLQKNKLLLSLAQSTINKCSVAKWQNAIDAPLPNDESRSSDEWNFVEQTLHVRLDLCKGIRQSEQTGWSVLVVLLLALVLLVDVILQILVEFLGPIP